MTTTSKLEYGGNKDASSNTGTSLSLSQLFWRYQDSSGHRIRAATTTPFQRALRWLNRKP